jgi:hypothetical protein
MSTRLHGGGGIFQVGKVEAKKYFWNVGLLNCNGKISSEGKNNRVEKQISDLFYSSQKAFNVK